MCGYLGKISRIPFNQESLIYPNKRIVCRGPDKTKILSFSKKNFHHSYIFNRLSIIDLSYKADQPMEDDLNGSVLMFNGEIFNHIELKQYLNKKGQDFKTDHSDTEVVLKGIGLEGLEFVKKLRGQFSIYFYDPNKNLVYLIRDRIGQKPLYYSITNNEILFSSNLKSIVELKEDKAPVSNESIFEYLVYGATKSPNTIYENIFKLPPATFLEINLNNLDQSSSPVDYWKITNYLNEKKFDFDEFKNIFEESVLLRSKADVPISNFLSGGIDSTAIVKAMKNSNEPLNTFNISFENKKIDESKYAKIVSDKYSTNHQIIHIKNNFSVNEVFKIISNLDEPYGDPSYIPNFIISKEMSKYFKVAMSGDGGDELLGGYTRVQKALTQKNIILNLFSSLYKYYPSFIGTGNILLKNSSNNGESFSSFIEDRNLAKFFGINNSLIRSNIVFPSNKFDIKDLLIADYNFYLTEMMMYKVDSSSMSNSLEVRSPLVDHKLIEYVFSHNIDYELENPKKLLKNYLKDDFDKNFLNRKKQGFEFDIFNFIYRNFNFFIEEIFKGPLDSYLEIEKIMKLRLVKSRINAIRIWKIFVLSNYLKD